MTVKDYLFVVSNGIYRSAHLFPNQLNRSQDGGERRVALSSILIATPLLYIALLLA